MSSPRFWATAMASAWLAAPIAFGTELLAAIPSVVCGMWGIFVLVPSLRSWLGRPSERVAFAGEHTSVRWQGYMSGAIESGRSAAVEVAVLAGLNYSAAAGEGRQA